MATADTVDLSPPHPPKEESVVAFREVLPQLKHELLRLRRDHDKFEPQYFAAVAQLEDHQLTDFSEADLVLVRVATSAYGIHLFNKLRIPAMPESGPAFVHFRIFIASGEPPKMHSIHTEEKEDADGSKSYRAIFTNDDELEWFET